MYRFIDTIEDYIAVDQLPAEALQINGIFIENVIEGYRTLYTSGREMIAPEINALELSRRHGQIYRSRRYPARVITVGFQLITSSPEEFREKFNVLNGILYTQEAQLVFADEPDKCFYGTLSDIDSPDPGRNAVVGEFSFTCSDPFKYSIEELEAVPGEDQGQTILIDYAGTVEAYPKLEVDFPKTGNDDVCSYLAFANDRGDVIQIGGVDTSEFIDGDASAKNLIYEYFYSDIDTRLCCGDDVFCSDSLPCCLSHVWQKNTGTFLVGDDTVTITGEAGVSETGSNGRLIAQSYGSGSSFHGPSVFAEVSNTSDGAVDFECAFRNYLEAGIDEKGMFAVTLNRSGEHESIIASLVLLKKEDREAVDILMIVNDVVRKRITVSLPLPAVSVRIAKEGSRVVFAVAGRTHTFIDDTLVSAGIHKIGFLFGAYSSETVLSENALEWVRLTDHPGDFTINDAVVADCRSASITMNDISRPALDVIGNDWETFVLKPGINQIRTSYKSSGSKPPAFKVRYREVFL